MGVPQKVNVKMNFSDGKIIFSLWGKDPNTQLRGQLARCELIGETTGIGHVEFTDIAAIVDDGIPVTKENAVQPVVPKPVIQRDMDLNALDITISEVSEEPVVKRKRGRPPKAKPVASSEQKQLPVGRTVTVEEEMLPMTTNTFEEF